MWLQKGSQYSTVLNLLQHWQKYLDKGEILGTLLMDLSKAYDCISHDLLIAKLEAYGFSFNSLNFVHSFLHGRKHRVKIGKIGNFADDNSLYTSGKSLDFVTEKLKHDTSIMLQWFSSNSMVAISNGIKGIKRYKRQFKFDFCNKQY